MAKLIIEVDLGDFTENPDPILIGVYRDGKYFEVKRSEMKDLKPGDIISFDEIYMLRDREDDSFYEAAFVSYKD